MACAIEMPRDAPWSWGHVLSALYPFILLFQTKSATREGEVKLALLDGLGHAGDTAAYSICVAPVYVHRYFH